MKDWGTICTDCDKVTRGPVESTDRCHSVSGCLIEEAPVPLTFRSFDGFTNADDAVSADQQQSSDDSAEELQMKLNVPQYDISAFLTATAPAWSSSGDLRASLSDETSTHEPFCLATIVVQGAGKSHTLACVLESSLLPVPSWSEEVIRLKNPMTAFILNYRSEYHIGRQSYFATCPGGPRVPKSRAAVLVSPSFYKQRKAFYGDYCTVRTLLFKWSSLTAEHIKRIMRIEADDNQLYVASFMSLLRGYQHQGVVPIFSRFMHEVKQVCNTS